MLRKCSSVTGWLFVIPAAGGDTREWSPFPRFRPAVEAVCICSVGQVPPSLEMGVSNRKIVSSTNVLSSKSQIGAHKKLECAGMMGLVIFFDDGVDATRLNMLGTTKGASRV